MRNPTQLTADRHSRVGGAPVTERHHLVAVRVIEVALAEGMCTKIAPEDVAEAGASAPAVTVAFAAAGGCWDAIGADGG